MPPSTRKLHRRIFQRCSRTYQYDAAGNITQIASELGQTQYAYDALQRLTLASPNTALQTLGLPQEQYSYDGVHNRTSSAHQAQAWAYNQDKGTSVNSFLGRIAALGGARNPHVPAVRCGCCASSALHFIPKI